MLSGFSLLSINEKRQNILLPDDDVKRQEHVLKKNK